MVKELISLSLSIEISLFSIFGGIDPLYLLVLRRISIGMTVRIFDSVALRDLAGTPGDGVNARLSRYCEFVTACGAIRPGVIPIIPAIILSPS